MYRLSIWYAAMPEDGDPQTHDLTGDQVAEFIRPEVGFMHDLLSLEGRGVRKLTLEAVVKHSEEVTV